MKISSFSIKNYRSFNDQGDTIKIGEMAAFVGKNSSGKSNILQALQLFWGQVSPSPEDFFFGDCENTINIAVTFSVDPEEITPALLPYVSCDGFLRLSREFTDADSKGKMFSSGKRNCSSLSTLNPFPAKKLSASQINSFLQSSEADNLISYANKLGYSLDTKSFYNILGLYWCDHLDAFPSEWADEPIELDNPSQKAILSALPSYYYLPVSYTAAKLTQDKHSYFQQLYQQILGDINQLLTSTHAEKIKRQVDRLYQESGIHKRCNDINQLLFKTNGADASVKMHIEIGEPDYSVLFHPSPALRVDDGYDCDVQNKGQGIQRDAIFRLLRVFSQLDTKHQKQFILAVDEPEAFMHPTYKRSLYKSFLNLCDVGCQVLYTTHDPAFVSVSRFDDIHTVIMKRGFQQYTAVFSSSFETLMNKEAFINACHSSTESAIRKELYHKCQGEQNEGFFADRIILVEGATESYALPIYFSRLGYDLDENNTVILRAESKSLLQLLCSIFSSCQIPCYCIFDGDKPKADVLKRFHAKKPIDEKECDFFKTISKRIKLNRSLLAVLKGTPVDFPQTTCGAYYTVWEEDFEHAIQMNLKDYEKIKSKITRKEGVSAESKPLVAYHLAVNSKMADFPQEIQDFLSSLIQSISNVPCLPLDDVSAPTNIIELAPFESDNSFPVYSSAAGRNLTVEDATPNSFATGPVPAKTAFLVHIQGDSMESQIPDGCYVAVKRINEPLAPGKIGIFSIDGGEMVCKQYIVLQNGTEVLKSLNPEHRPIVLQENTRYKTYGEVIMLGRKQPAIFYAKR